MIPNDRFPRKGARGIPNPNREGQNRNGNP